MARASADDPDDAALRALRAIPNVGPATARDLLRLGIGTVAELRGREPRALFETLCALDGVRHDPCTRDVLIAAVAFAEGREVRPWWAYTPERKRLQREQPGR